MYKERYGAWAGNPVGQAPDMTRCCEEVRSPDGWRYYQCGRKRGHGPDGAYCKQHDPATVAARRAEADRKYKAQANKDRYKWYGKTFHDALRQIAEGHNDARGLAQEVLDVFDRGSY